jgi:uncharacterized protein (DUF433 family)
MRAQAFFFKAESRAEGCGILLCPRQPAILAKDARTRGQIANDRDTGILFAGESPMNDQWRARITIEPGKRGGQPCIRGMRLTVQDVLEYLAGGMTVEEVLDDFPELTLDDVRACLAYAADRERRLRT